MDFGFQARGGTAPTLTSAGYVRSSHVVRPTAGDPYRYCEQVEDEDGVLGLPKAPVFHAQRQGKGATRVSTKKIKGYHQPRAGWGKRHTERRRHSDSMGPMLSTRPASRQALSDLMDLNLALKFDKMGKNVETIPQRERSHPIARSTSRNGRRHDGCAPATDSPSSPGRFSASLNRPEGPTSSRYTSPRERYNAKANSTFSLTTTDAAHNDHFHEAGIQKEPVGPRQDSKGQHDRRVDDTYSVHLHATTATMHKGSHMTPPSMYFEAQPRESSPEVRTSAVSTLVERVAANTTYKFSGSSTRNNGNENTRPVDNTRDYSRPVPGSDGEMYVFVADDKVGNNQGHRSPGQENSSQQSEKDQRMWSALKTSLLTRSEGDTDRCYNGPNSGKIETDDTPRGSGVYIEGESGEVGGETRNFYFLKGARDMEQLDLERSAMDRTMRPHRVASARLLETNQECLSPSKVKHPRNFSASATRPRTRQSDSISSVWLGAGGTLQCTGVRAELVSRNGDSQPGFSNDAVNGAKSEGCCAFASGFEVHQREGGKNLARKNDLRRSQWVTNDDGVANFLQRPPSRQKEAFPTYLADVIPYAAFQIELPMAQEKTQQHIEATRKNAVEQARPPSRHKPPGESLFLEVPDTRRQIPPVFSSSRSGVPTAADSCGSCPSGVLPIDSADVEAATAREAIGTVFALDRRHDNPDRDGFSVLQVQGPCPFRIEVTNSLVQPRPPTVPVCRENNLAMNRSGGSKIGTCSPNASCGLFGPITYDVGGRTSTGKQRAPINTTPPLAVSLLASPAQVRIDTIGKGNCGTSFRTLGTRTIGGVTSRGTHSPVYTGVRGETSSPIEDFPSPPPLVGNGTREFDIRGRTSEGSRVSGSGEGIIDDVMRRKADAGAAGGNTVLGRVETSRLRVHTGAPGLNVSDWSLQSCDDADDGAFLDGPASTLGESAGTAHTLLGTTLGQDFLSLFAPAVTAFVVSEN